MRSIPHGQTARRLEWPHLPPNLRAWIERKIGSPVLEALSQTAGFTPGFASVLVAADGSRHFVKAASLKAQKPFAEAYRVEAAVVAGLPQGIEAPRLRALLDDDWVCLVFEYVAARAPARPWQPAELAVTLDAVEQIAAVGTPAPAGLTLRDFSEAMGHWPQLWEQVPGLRPEWGRGEVARAAQLAAGFADACRGDTLVHGDLRDDNVLLIAGRDGGADGVRATFCDWNWPTRGAAWIDTVAMLIGPRGDGLDVESILAERKLTQRVDPAKIDAFLALLTGYFVVSSGHPVPPSSPFIRDAQRWQGDVCWEWLNERLSGRS